jgi:hypothetical protein
MQKGWRSEGCRRRPDKLRRWKAMSMATARHESRNGGGEIQRVGRVSEGKERMETLARSTATSTVTVDNLTEARELPSDGLILAACRRGPVDE